MIFGVSILSFPLDLWARAGGAGGGSDGGDFGGGQSYSYGGGSSGDGDFIRVVFEIIFRLIRMGPVGWLILAAIVFVLYKVFTGRRIQYAEERVRPDRIRVNKGLPVDPIFRAKIETAFRTVQQAWTEQRPELMRRFITDGVHQRFHAQFTMMKLLGQTNPISNIQIYSIDQMMSPRENMGLYESVDIRIEASARDQFISSVDPSLNSVGGAEHFVEFWSFIRRRDGDHTKDIFNSNLCPKCSAPLGLKMMDDARCDYCGSSINNGEFDWVLAEITQADDYGGSMPTLNLPAELTAANSTFSVQVLEDKASNAFMQILIGAATHNLEPIRRFTLDQEFEKIRAEWSRGHIVYDRLYLNSVMARTIEWRDGLLHANVHVRFTYRQPPSSQLATQERTLVLVHRPANVSAKGTIYANECSTCGAPQKDSLSHRCLYCGSNLNDITRDWIVGGIF